VPNLLAAGAYGVAVVSAVSDAADPAAATRDLLRALAAPGVRSCVETAAESCPPTTGSRAVHRFGGQA